MKIRNFEATEADYEAVAAMQTAVYPDTPAVAADYRQADEFMDADGRCHVRRWLAEVEGTVAGTSAYWQHPGNYHPHHFGVMVYVHPDFQGRGIGSALYGRTVDALAPHAPRQLRIHSRTDQPRGIRFLEERGYTELRRAGESRLDVQAFDPAPYASLQGRVAASGIALRSLAELAGDPRRNEKLHALHWALIQDVPGAEDATLIPLDQWVAAAIESETALPAGYFVALDGDEYVGLTELLRDLASDTLITGLTGVLPAYRRRGIATALKLRAIRFAREQDNPYIKTQNEVGNRPMLSINEQLGFERLPEWILFEKKLDSPA